MAKAVYSWIQKGLISSKDQYEALIQAGERASPAAWRVFIERVLVMLGLLSLACGVVFFFAYNWNEISRFYKFLTLQVLLVAVVSAYLKWAKNHWLQQAMMITAALVLGALLALFGQTYQTGADPWQLFATWALLITPWVWLSRAEAMWIFWAVLLNTALILKFEVDRSLLGWSLSQHQVSWAFLLLNGLLLCVTEWVSLDWRGFLKRVRLQDRWAALVMGLMVLFVLTTIGLLGIWGDQSVRAASLLTFLVVMAIWFYVYRFIKKDLLLLTAWAMAVIVFILSLLANSVFDSFDAGGLLLMAISLIAMTTFAVSWIKKTHGIFKQEASHE